MICQRGEITCHGATCSEPGAVMVEHMPSWLRSSHEAARNRGVYPHNGAIRVVLCEACAAELVDDDWTTQVTR